MLASLGQKPKLSELAELLSALQSSREMNGEDATHFGFDDFCQVLEGNIIYDTASAAIPATSIIFVGCCKQG